MTDEAELAYLAGIVDTLAILRVRTTPSSDLPMVALHGPFEAALRLLAERTDTAITITTRDYQRAACVEHCPTAHEHIQSVSGRWSVTGTKATVLLENLLPYMRAQADRARELIEVGRSAGFKPKTREQMRLLGWQVAS